MSDSQAGPLVDAAVLGALLLDLYRFARELPLVDFQERVLERLAEALPFDSAWWGMSALDRELHSSFPFRVPQDFVDHLCGIRGQDLMADELMGNPGVSLNFDYAALHATPVFTAFVDRFDTRQALSTLLMNPDLNLTTFLSLYRRGPGSQPFSEAERQLKQMVMPHLWAAWSSNWIAQLAAAKAHSVSDRVSLAVADQKGLLHAAEPRFSELMQMEWPRWSGPELPTELRADLRLEGPRERHVLTTQLIPVRGLYLVEVRRRSALDRLTARERLIAEHFGSGKSYKEIAASLTVAPATVRAHLRAIYSKLKISDKTELAALL
ncbi:MAG: helix-turn-helix transcriptional regulator [Proteobacteria bacterium]|nr:helix-turn-helix transcriptional regulator [Pseudomonadota bacterium]